MKKKTQAEIEELFEPYLRDGEVFCWIGEPKHNFWKLKIGQIPDFIFALIGVLAWLFIIGGLVSGSIYLLYFLLKTAAYVILVVVLVVGFAARLLYMDWKKEGYMRVGKREGYNPFRIFQLSYYAITNQRTLIFEQGAIHDYSLLLLADAVVNKPKFGTSDINLYYSTNRTGQLPEPVFQLKGIAEEEAQAAYEILRQAWEEALDERARDGDRVTMAKKTHAKILETFRPQLHYGEEIFWVGQAERKTWELNQSLLARLLALSFFLLFYLGCATLYLVPLIIIFVNMDGISLLAFACIFLPFCLFLLWFRYQWNKGTPPPIDRNYNFSHSIQIIRQTASYAISNQRVLKSEYGRIQAYDLMQIDETALGKAKNGLTTIHLYGKAKVNGQALLKSILQLKDIDENQAQEVYKILEEMRER